MKLLMFQAKRFWNGHVCKCMVGDDNRRFRCMLDVPVDSGPRKSQTVSMRCRGLRNMLSGICVKLDIDGMIPLVLKAVRCGIVTPE